MIDSGAIPPLLSLALDAGTDSAVRTEACWVVLNCTSCGDDEQLQYMVRCGAVSVLYALLADGGMVLMALEGLERVLRLCHRVVRAQQGEALASTKQAVMAMTRGGGVQAAPRGSAGVEGGRGADTGAVHSPGQGGLDTPTGADGGVSKRRGRANREEGGDVAAGSASGGLLPAVPQGGFDGSIAPPPMPLPPAGGGLKEQLRQLADLGAGGANDALVSAVTSMVANTDAFAAMQQAIAAPGQFTSNDVLGQISSVMQLYAGELAQATATAAKASPAWEGGAAAAAAGAAGGAHPPRPPPTLATGDGTAGAPLSPGAVLADMRGLLGHVAGCGDSVARRAQRLWTEFYVSCALCAVPYPKAADVTRYCSECKCFVCDACDCYRFHLSVQAALWAEEDGGGGKGGKGGSQAPSGAAAAGDTAASKKSKKARRKARERARRAAEEAGGGHGHEGGVSLPAPLGGVPSPLLGGASATGSAGVLHVTERAAGGFTPLPPASAHPQGDTPAWGGLPGMPGAPTTQDSGDTPLGTASVSIPSDQVGISAGLSLGGGGWQGLGGGTDDALHAPLQLGGGSLNVFSLSSGMGLGGGSSLATLGGVGHDFSEAGAPAGTQ